MASIVNTPFDFPIGVDPFATDVPEFPTGPIRCRGSYIVAQGDSKVTAGTPLERKRYLVRVVFEHEVMDAEGKAMPTEAAQFIVVPAGCPVDEEATMPPDVEFPKGHIMRLVFVTMARNPYTDAIPVCIYRVVKIRIVP